MEVLMNFSAQKNDLLESLQKTHAIVASKSTLSVLANVLIEALENKVVFTTTNLQVGIRCESPASVLEKGASTLPARTLFGIIRELAAGEVNLTIDEENVATIQCADSLFKVLGISKEEFPRVAQFQGEPLFTIPQAEFREMLRRTSFAVSREDPRHFLTGMYVSIDKKCLLLVGTDGRRLSRIQGHVEAPEDYTGSLIVPIKAVEELEKMLGDAGEVQVFLSGNQVGFQVGTDLLVSLLIDAKFPDYEGVIPKSSAGAAVLQREEFAAKVRQAALLTSEQSSSVRLRFQRDEVVITASTPELGEARVTMPVKYDGNPMSIAFNPMCIRDVLNCMDEDDITLDLIDSVSPGVIRGKGDFLHLIMPMRLPEEEE
jgi:DNA polymerase-3 subunit beta